MRSDVDVDFDAAGPRLDLGHARRNDLEPAMVTSGVLRGRLADDLGEAGAERAERRTTDGHARVGDRHPLTQKRLRPFDASRHQVRVRRLAICGAELAGEVCRRHQRGARHRRHIERQRVLAIHEISRPAQVRKIGELFPCHPDDGIATGRDRDQSVILR